MIIDDDDEHLYIYTPITLDHATLLPYSISNIYYKL